MIIRPLAATVVSPYQRCTSPPEASPRDVADINPAPIADEPAAPGMGRLSAVVLAFATAASLVAPGAMAQTLASTSTAQATTTTLADRITGPGLNHARARLVRESLDVLPPNVREALDRSQVRIHVVDRAADLLKEGIITPTPIPRSYAPIRRQAERVIPPVERLFTDLVSRAEARLHEADGQEAFIEARMLADEITEQREMWIRRAVFQATEGRIETFVDPDLRSSLQDAARIHGARTPEESREFISLTRSLNPKLSRASDATPLESRILVPAFDYHRDADGAPAVRLSTHDRISLQVWREDGANGQYFYAGRGNVLVLRSDVLDGPDGRRVVVHELGHAYEDAVSEQSPSRYAAFQRKRDAAYLRLQESGTFPTPHASSSPSELVAESFEMLLHGEPIDDAQWSEDMRGFIAP